MDKLLNQITLIFSNTLGFIIKEPVYKSFQYLCVIQIAGIAISFYLLFDLINFYKSNVANLNPDNVNAIFAFCSAIFATIWVNINSIHKTSITPTNTTTGT